MLCKLRVLELAGTRSEEVRRYAESDWWVNPSFVYSVRAARKGEPPGCLSVVTCGNAVFFCTWDVADVVSRIDLALGG